MNDVIIRAIFTVKKGVLSGHVKAFPLEVDPEHSFAELDHFRDFYGADIIKIKYLAPVCGYGLQMLGRRYYIYDDLKSCWIPFICED